VAEAVYIDRMAGAASLGVLVCRSSGGVTIAANKVPSMRAVAINSVESAQHARAHNDALVATLSGEWVDQDLALEITRVFIETPFSGEKRHLRRIKQIAAYEYSTDKP
jgi:ribose 5-phosphate isomerase B